MIPTVLRSSLMSVVRKPAAGDHVILVDGSSFIFRAYFQSMNQDPRYNYRSDRLPTGAVRLFCTVLYKLIREGVMGRKGSHLAIIFDKSEESFRKELYPAYKAHRPPPPEDLVPQFPLMRRAVSAFGLRPIEQIRYEADDLIATYARLAREAGAEVTVVSHVATGDFTARRFEDELKMSVEALVGALTR